MLKSADIAFIMRYGKKNSRNYIENCGQILKDALNRTRNSTVTDITSGREAKKTERKKKGNNYYKGDSNIVTQPRSDPAQQGLTLLSRRKMVMSLGDYNSTHSKLLFTPNDNKQVKYSSLSLELTSYSFPSFKPNRPQLLHVG